MPDTALFIAFGVYAITATVLILWLGEDAKRVRSELVLGCLVAYLIPALLVEDLFRNRQEYLKRR